jgi:hypothetical protein
MDLGLLVWNSLHAIPLEIKYRASFESFRILGIFFLSLDVVFLDEEILDYLDLV